MLDDVERRAFGGEQGARLAGKAQQIGAGRDGVAILGAALDRHIGVERAEEGFGDRQAGDDDRVAAVHHAGEARVGRDHRRGGDVARLAQILGERGGDEGVEIEAVEGKGHAAALKRKGGGVSPWDQAGRGRRRSTLAGGRPSRSA